MRIVCLYGGAPIGKQIDALKKHPQIVVATPGRLSDHMKRRTVKLDNVKTVVLDEADRMLDMGFIHDVTRILDKLSSRRNLGMFSATISREVMDISWMYQRDPEEITVQAKEENKPDIAQYRIDVGQNDKAHVMAQIIRAEGHERVMAFCNTKGMTERLKAFLMMEGLEADCIHGDIPQKKREAVMARFRRGELPIFVATDVAARGIDVDDVDAVFNYDVPLENEYYVHRIGRTARANRDGRAITFVSEEDQYWFQQIEKFLEKVVEKMPLPEGCGEGPEYIKLNKPKKKGANGRNNRRGNGGNGEAGKNSAKNRRQKDRDQTSHKRKPNKPNERQEKAPRNNEQQPQQGNRQQSAKQQPQQGNRQREQPKNSNSQKRRNNSNNSNQQRPGNENNVRPGSNGRGRGVAQKKGDKPAARKHTPIVNPQKQENAVKKFIKRIFGFKK